jgi:hypothetical protein
MEKNPETGSGILSVRDPGWEKSDPGSGLNIPDLYSVEGMGALEPVLFVLGPNPIHAFELEKRKYVLNLLLNYQYHRIVSRKH